MKKLLSKYKHAWVFVYFIFYVPWYFGLQFRGNIGFHDIYTTIDRMIPFVPIFIYPYVYWFLFVACTIAYLFFTHRDEFYKCVAFLFTGMTICLIVFTVFPSSFAHRPDVIVADPLTKYLLDFIYTADKCQNVFPSIHVFNSIGCAIAIVKCSDFKDNKGMHILAYVSAILITLSTMFIKQHSILDAVSAGLLSVVLYQLVYVVDWVKVVKKVKTMSPIRKID